MAKLILTSASSLLLKGTETPDPRLLEVLRRASKEGSLVALASNQAKPPWLTDELAAFLKFVRVKDGRQRGQYIPRLVAANKEKGLAHSDIVVLGVTDIDFFMAVNSQTLFLRCDWVKGQGERASQYGVPLRDPEELPIVLRILDDKDPWYFQGEAPGYSVFSLTDAGTYGERNEELLRLVGDLRQCLKLGAKDLSRGFLLHLLSSLYVTDEFRSVDYWAYYPSSESTNSGDEVMRWFCDQARTLYKKKEHGPLFIRHKKSPRRHEERHADRTNPQSQMTTVHLNPAYKGKVAGKKVAVLDDYLTYGVSFGVGSALLRKAGASSTICVAMGKFGGTARAYDIVISAHSVFRPLSETDYAYSDQFLSGKDNYNAQARFLEKFGTRLEE